MLFALGTDTQLSHCLLFFAFELFEVGDVVSTEESHHFFVSGTQLFLHYLFICMEKQVLHKYHNSYITKISFLKKKIIFQDVFKISTKQSSFFIFFEQRKEFCEIFRISSVLQTKKNNYYEPWRRYTSNCLNDSEVFEHQNNIFKMYSSSINSEGKDEVSKKQLKFPIKRAEKN